MSEGLGQFPEGIDPALIHLTGTIVTWWGRIEGILVNDLVTLRQLKANTAFVAKEPFPISTGRVIEQWAKLQRRYYAGDEAKLDSLGRFKSDLTDAAEERNVLVHYFWPYGADEGQKTISLKSIKPQKGNNDALMISVIDISVDQLDALNNRLVRIYHRVMADMLNLMMKVKREHGPVVIGRTDDR